jgi:ribosomal protein S18 acetylase RimI-like enzyme
MRDVQFRPARIGDLLSLYRSCYSDRPLPQFRDSFQRSIRAQQSGKRVLLVAKKEETLVGSGQIIAYNHKVEIADLIVAPAYRSQGIGTAIIEILIRLAAYTPFEEVEIGVMAANKRALALYKRLGFTPLRELQLADEARAIILRRRIK